MWFWHLFHWETSELMCGGDITFLITSLAEFWCVALSEFFRRKHFSCSWTVLLS